MTTAVMAERGRLGEEVRSSRKISEFEESPDSVRGVVEKQCHLTCQGSTLLDLILVVLISTLMGSLLLWRRATWMRRGWEC